MFVNIVFILVSVCLVLASRDPVADSKRRNKSGGAPYTRITKRETQCEVEALSIGSALTDNYNSLDEETEWDSRIHSDYLSEYLGFFGIITQGVWGKPGRTSELRDSVKLQKRGKWLGLKNITESAYWALENQWLYMMGDSTQRQVWATFVSPSQGNEFERNSKEWTRENCRKQFPHRRRHPANGVFPDEGWSGKCGNNEVTCDLSGYGPRGKMTFDWKHFPYEDYDEWLFGETGPWGNQMDEEDSHTHEEVKETPHGTDNANGVMEGGGLARRLREEHVHDVKKRRLGDPALSLAALLEDGSPHEHHAHHDMRHLWKTDAEIYTGTFKKRAKVGDELRRPDILVVEVGLHTCFHGWDNFRKIRNETYIAQHERDLVSLFDAIKRAITRPTVDNKPPSGPETIVIISTAGRIGTDDTALDHCTWRWNRQLALEAHKAGFPVFEREEIERRLLFKSDTHLDRHQGRYIKPNMHLAAPSPQIVATSLMAMISCLRSARGQGANIYPYHASADKHTIPIHSSASDDNPENRFD
jgi:hypothetical protein